MNGAGERRLMLAVLIDGLRMLAHHPSPRRRLEELRWVTGTERDHPFAFEPLCEALGVDPARLRRCLAPLLHEVEMRGGRRVSVRSRRAPAADLTSPQAPGASTHPGTCYPAHDG
jgi:hypothetical protein